MLGVTLVEWHPFYSTSNASPYSIPVLWLIWHMIEESRFLQVVLESAQTDQLYVLVNHSKPQGLFFYEKKNVLRREK